MKKISVFLLCLFAININIFSQQKFPSYYEINDFSLAPTSAMKYGLYGFNNPAVLNFLHQPDIYFTWNDREGDYNDFENWGLFTAVPNFGFSVVTFGDKQSSVVDYKLSTAFGGQNFSLGLGYSWSTGDKTRFERSSEFTLGSIIRMNKYISMGLIVNLPTQTEREGIVDLAVRPLGNEIITLFGDYIFTNDQVEKSIRWSAGAVLEPFDGIRFTGRIFEGKAFTAGVQLNLGNIGFTSQSHFNKDKNYAYNTYGIRIGAYDRNIFRNLFAGNNYVEMNLYGGMSYQRYQLFDDSNTLLDIITQIEAAKNDNTISGIALNLSGMKINREMLWEIRSKLEDFKSKGKKVVVYIDRGGIDEYHFATVADRIVLDPLGSITIEGYAMGRTYYKGMLEKIGVGFHELRYFKYKSAAETFANDEMSEADREQRQRLVDEYYRIAKSDICRARNISFEKFEELVNEKGMFLPADAIMLGLVDTLGRWENIKEVVKSIENVEKKFVSAASLEKFNLPTDNYWGSKPAVAVIYAIGGTSMDDGIKARTLVKYVEAAVKSNNVKAIVLRVDSPGGDVLASDLIAEALKKGKGKKPIIVSQGYVAASGGYWLSMYADTIVASPNTITGSIGVIGSFIYNKDLKEKLGFSTDYVKVGRFSDLGFGATIPLLGIMIPDRDLSNEELSIAETSIKTMYKDFVSKVAAGRNKSYDEIHEIGEGRVWSGADGKLNGLVDVLGGLDTAIEIAVKRAGLKNNLYDIIEMPERPLINLSKFMPSLLPGIINSANDDVFLKDLKFRLSNNGIPMPLLPMEYIDDKMILNRFEEN